MNPADLGYFERRPSSGIWYLSPERGATSFEPKVCENPECPLPGREFMGTRQKGRGRFCSLSCAAWKTDPEYAGRHLRIGRVRGKASEHTCADCCNRAYDWSQRHGTDGTDPEHYDPRCRPCHRAYDGTAHGEDHGRATLTEAQVREIYASTGVSQQELADIHGTTQHNVSNIRRGKTWKHVTGTRATT